MKTLRIRNWRENFENNRTRELKRMDWVPISNKMDTRSYIRLVTHPNGPAHLGAWLALVEIASRCDPRGTLPWEGAEIPQALAEISRIPAGLFDEVIPRLVDLKWIEEVTGISHEGAEIPQDDAVKPQDGAPRARAVTEGKGKKGTESKAGVLTMPPSGERLIAETAERMYDLHPKKRHVVLVLDSLSKAVGMEADPAAKLKEIETVHAAWCEEHDWTKENGKFAPVLAEWISDKGFTKWPKGREPTKKPAFKIPVWRPYDPETLDHLEPKPTND